MMFRDSFGRPISNIRVSLTQRCNLDCIYCHREGHPSAADREFSSAELERLMRVAVPLGIDRVKLTGGEPTLRRDLVEIVERLASIPHMNEISMTTNGTLLESIADELKHAGLKRVNVTVDSLKPEVYFRITRRDLLSDALRGVQAAVSAGLTPVKVNVVVLKSMNDSEVQDLVSFSSKTGAILQLIELVSKNDESDLYRRYHCDLGSIEEGYARNAVRVIDRGMNNRKKYVLPEGAEVEVVKPMHNTAFCLNCHRIRLTSDGYLKPCLMRDNNLVDILTPMRLGARDSELAALIKKAIQQREPYYKIAS